MMQRVILIGGLLMLAACSRPVYTHYQAPNDSRVRECIVFCDADYNQCLPQNTMTPYQCSVKPGSTEHLLHSSCPQSCQQSYASCYSSCGGKVDKIKRCSLCLW